jgi:inorganic pyrophosphatase
MFLDSIPVGSNPPDEVNVLIEVPLGGEPVKYELGKNAGILVVDRFLYTPMRYPGNYGFVPHTLSGDGDPCDVIVADEWRNDRPLTSMKLSQLESRFMTNADWPLLCLDKYNSDTSTQNLE